MFILYQYVTQRSSTELSFKLQSLPNKLCVLCELMDLIHFALGLRGTTVIEVFRIISHQLITWLIVISYSRVFCWYIFVVSAYLCIKYAFLASLAFKINAAKLLKGIRYKNFYVNFALEFILGNLCVLEYLISVW